MTISDAKRKATAAYQKRQDNIMIRPSKAEGARIRAAAQQADKSVQAYILDTLRLKMDEENVPEMEEDQL